MSDSNGYVSWVIVIVGLTPARIRYQSCVTVLQPNINQFCRAAAVLQGGHMSTAEGSSVLLLDTDRTMWERHLSLVRHTPDTTDVGAASPAINKQLHLKATRLNFEQQCLEWIKYLNMLHLLRISWVTHQHDDIFISAAITHYHPNIQISSQPHASLCSVSMSLYWSCLWEETTQLQSSLDCCVTSDWWYQLPSLRPSPCWLSCHSNVSYSTVSSPPPPPSTIYPSQSNKLLHIYFYFISESQHTVTNGRDTQNTNHISHNISRIRLQHAMQTETVQWSGLPIVHCHQQEFISQGSL